MENYGGSLFITVSEMKPYSTWEITRAKIANSVLLCQTFGKCSFPVVGTKSRYPFERKL